MLPNRYPPILGPHSKPSFQPFLHPEIFDPSCVLALSSQRDNKWFDNSGNDNHGVFTDTVIKSNGRFGPSVSFNGTSSFVICGNNTVLDITSEITFEVWVNPSNISTNTKILDKSHLFVDAWTLIKNDSNFECHIKFPVVGLKSAIATGMASIGVWSHVVATYDGDKLRIYVDSILKGSNDVGSDTIPINSRILHVGRLSSLPLSFFPGLIDEVRLYNRALNHDEISRNYELGRPN